MVTSGNAISKLVVGPLFGFGAGWIVDRCGCGEAEEGLAGDLQILALGVELTEAGGEFGDVVPESSGLLGDFALADLDVCQYGLGLGDLTHAPLQEGIVMPARRRDMTDVIAQNTREREEVSRCS